MAAMTPKTVLSVDLTEIGSLEIRCHCSAVTSLPVAGGEPSNVFTCPSCGVQLWGEKDNPAYNLVRDLMLALGEWNKRQKTGKTGFRIGFTLDAPKS